MTEPQTLAVYTDYRSPYAYLAKDLVYELERDFRVRVDWLPYSLDIPSFLGSARVDDGGRGIEEARNPHQWRRVRYSYMDCRRQARKRGLVIRGPQKIWDSTLAACGMLYARRQGEAVLRRYHDITFERFWKRELDIEDPKVIGAVLAEAGAGTAGFSAFFGGGGEGGARPDLPCSRGDRRFRSAQLRHRRRVVLGPRTSTRYPRDTRDRPVGLSCISPAATLSSLDEYTGVPMVQIDEQVTAPKTIEATLSYFVDTEAMPVTLVGAPGGSDRRVGG